MKSIDRAARLCTRSSVSAHSPIVLSSALPCSVGCKPVDVEHRSSRHIVSVSSMSPKSLFCPILITVTARDPSQAGVALGTAGGGVSMNIQAWLYHFYFTTAGWCSSLFIFRQHQHGGACMFMCYCSTQPACPKAEAALQTHLPPTASYS